MNELWLAFEGGGTKTRMLLGRTDGAVLASEVGSCSNGYYIDPEHYRSEMTQRLSRLRNSAELAGARVSTAGLAGPMDSHLVESIITQVFGPVEFVRAGESAIALACHGLRTGIAVVAGTGSSCTGVNERGETGRSGGFGPQFDDLGSAYWIGCRAVEAVVRADDGRGPQTRLHERLFAYAEITDLWELLRLCDRNGHVARQYIAAFAPQVFEAAREGDAAALRICAEAGRHLGELVGAVIRQLPFERAPIHVVPCGGVFHGGDLVLDGLKTTLPEEADIVLYPPVLEPAPGLFQILTWHREKDDQRVS